MYTRAVEPGRRRLPRYFDAACSLYILSDTYTPAERDRRYFLIAAVAFYFMPLTPPTPLLFIADMLHVIDYFFSRLPSFAMITLFF